MNLPEPPKASHSYLIQRYGQKQGSQMFARQQLTKRKVPETPTHSEGITLEKVKQVREMFKSKEV